MAASSRAPVALEGVPPAALRPAARRQAAMLVDQAVAHLRGFGAEADLLRAIARYVVERDR